MTKLKLKGLVMAVALAAAGAAQATPINLDGYDGATPGNGTGDGDILLSVFDPIANLSLVMNTGLTVGNFMTNNASLINVFSTTDSNLQSFFTTNAADLASMQWNLGGLSNGPGIGPESGVLTSNGTTSIPVPSIDSNTAYQAMNVLTAYATNNAFGLSSSNVSVSSPATSGTGWSSGTWGTTIGGQLGFNNAVTGFSGTQQTMTYFGMDAGDPVGTVAAAQDTFTDGWFTVNTSTGTLAYVGPVSAVPVPAAVWLFGSGLLGLVGIGRRRKQH